jgi:hypothetical protein
MRIGDGKVSRGNPPFLWTRALFMQAYIARGTNGRKEERIKGPTRG